MVKKIYGVQHARELAAKRLPKMVYDFLEGGALDEVTLRRNREAFEELVFEQRVLTDQTELSVGTHALGRDLKLPLVVSPMGLLSIIHREGDKGIARAAAAAGSVMIHSPWSGFSVEEVHESAAGNLWAQVAFWSDRQETMQHVSRAKNLGIETLVVAGDVAFSSKRDRDIKHGTGMPPKPPLRDVVDVALHPRWFLGWLLGTTMTWGTYQIDGRRIRMTEMDGWMERQETLDATFEDIAQLRAVWDGKLAVKGIMTKADAKLAIDAGADVIFVSNHGGRQFDGQPATMTVLPEIAEAVAGRAEIILDGGVRRGSDMMAALSHGADLVAAGRPFAYGLAARGTRGVSEVFEALADEFQTALGFTGNSSVAELRRTEVLV